jgi:hypothetical protein
MYSAKVRHFQLYAERPRIFITDKTIFSSEIMLRRDQYRKRSIGGKKSLVVGLKGLDDKTKLIGGKPPVVK